MGIDKKMRTTAMTKNEAAFEEAEAFVRRAVSYISEKPVSESAIKKAAQKVARAVPTVEQHVKVDV
jgi:hypothetical protein